MSAASAARILPPVKAVTGVATVLMLVGMSIVYRRDMLQAVGSFAILGLVLFLTGITAAAYGLSRGLPQDQRSVLGVGMCTRNVGAALVPLVAIEDADPRALAMCVIAAVVTAVLAAAAAAVFARRAQVVIQPAGA